MPDDKKPLPEWLRDIPGIDPDDEWEVHEFTSDEEARVLTSISQECLREECDRCPGTFKHPDAGDEMVFCVHDCHKVNSVV